MENEKEDRSTEKDLERRPSAVSENSADSVEESDTPTPEDISEARKRKSSYGFDEYRFESTVLDESEDVLIKANQEVERDAEKFMQMARLKTNIDYSKMDLVKMASTLGGLLLDETMVEPVPIPEGIQERSEAVHAIYGPELKPESEPFKDPVTALELADEEDVPDRIQSPANLYEALQSNFLKSNYKTSIYRLFLLGTHDENLSYFIEWNRDVIDNINSQSYTESLQGVLCVYEYYYIHVIEGSEDNLVKLMQKYVNDLEPSGYEWDLKYHLRSARYTARDHVKFHTVQSWMLGIFRIQQRQLLAWRGEKVFPNKMHYGDVPAGGFREKYFHFLRQCMLMAFTYNQMAPTGFNPEKEGSDEMSTQMRKAIERAKIQRFKSLGKVVTPITFIQYVLDHKDNSKLKIRTIREHLELFGSTPPFISTSNTEWPPPGRIAPYD